jgi:hypothetical protein
MPIDVPKSDTSSMPPAPSLQHENNVDMCDTAAPVEPEC